MAEEQNIRRKYKSHKIKVAVFCIVGVIFISTVLIYLDRTINSHTHIPIPDPNNPCSISNINNEEGGQCKLGWIGESDRDSVAESLEEMDHDGLPASRMERPALENVRDVITTIVNIKNADIKNMDIKKSEREEASIQPDIVSTKIIELKDTIVQKVILYCKEMLWSIKKTIPHYWQISHYNVYRSLILKPLYVDKE
ncbi:hypothetical protein NEIG_02122 [Nematocida sp. ERTm5]|nr:hypothetical protein NEIG_02122 [Nematocida sp. ERTm5]